jgi:dTDP-6-deoxy-L-talose 4-dehydrogenase (NAD+)
MKILVTGANGYLGQGIVKAILDKKAEVVAADFSTQYVDERAIRISCDLFEVENPYDYFGKPDMLLHLAWRDGFVHYSDAHIEELPRHYSFIQKMAESGIGKISVMGSMHEIGFYEGSIDENTPCKPESFYGIAKNALRDITKLYCKQNNVLFQWLRGYYIVGNSKFGSSIFSKITEAAEKGQKEFPFTMGLNQFDFLNYEDFCEQVASVVSQDEINGIINICSGRPEKLADRVERFIKENGYDIKLVYGAFPDRPYDSKAVWGNSSKIERIMGK